MYLTAVQSEKFKTSCFSVNFLRPLLREEAAPNALTGGVLLAGCSAAPDIRSISIKLDTLYGASVGTLVRKKGAVQSVGFYADFVEDRVAGEAVFRPLAEFAGELLLHPCTENSGFREDYFSMEKDNLINALRASLNNKQSYANLCLLKKMFKDERYGIPSQGEEADLQNVTAKSLFAQYRNVLAGSRVELFYLGRADADEAAQTLKAMLKGLPREQIVPLTQPENKAIKQVQRFEQTMELAQSKLSMGFRAMQARSKEELAAMLVFCVIYGSGSSCKLFLNVREAKSLWSYADAMYDK